MTDADKPLNPPVGISHVTRTITDLYARRINNAQRVTLRSASQLNAYPHLGTIFTLASAFALSEQLHNRFGVQVSMEFWSLDNAPAVVRDTEIGLYYKPLFAHPSKEDPTRSMSEVHGPVFDVLLEHFSELTGTPHEVLTYRQFQGRTDVRVQMLRLLNRSDHIAHLLTPTEQHVKLRFPCPKCGWTAKKGGLILGESTRDLIVTSSVCSEHGEYRNVLSGSNDDYFDTNTPVRALIREILSVRQSLSDPHLQSIFCDGADWAHFGDINAQALWTLGEPVAYVPMRFFAPTILDESGAKLSKSAQVGSDAYDHLDRYLVDGKALLAEFGRMGLTRILDETRGWMDDSKQIFRSYTINHVNQVLTGSP